MGSRRQSRAKPIHVAGRYALFDQIAAGGMASVHLGRQLGDAGFARTVAIKRMRPGLVDDPRLITMFVDEARLAGRVQHPNVVTTIDVVHDHGELFLVMEYVHGESLKALVTDTGKLVAPPPEISAGIACGALRGLHAAHEAKGEDGQPLGIVHRDVSPQNLLVSSDGTTRVVDFGVAKAAGRLQWTQTGQLKGKPRYMAPEQLTSRRNHPIDRRTDVFSMATLLWELLAGKRLFDDVDDLAVLRKVLSMPITSPLEHNPKVPAALALAVMKGLEREPARRYPTTREFARAVEASMPRGVASQDTVGEWVTSIAGARLANLERRILEIENAAPSDMAQARDMVGAVGDSTRGLGGEMGIGEAPTVEAPSEDAPASSITSVTGFSAEGTDTDIDAGRLLAGGSSLADSIRLGYESEPKPKKTEVIALDDDDEAAKSTAKMGTQARPAAPNGQTTDKMVTSPRPNDPRHLQQTTDKMPPPVEPPGADVADLSSEYPTFSEDDGANDITRKMQPTEVPQPVLKVPDAHLAAAPPPGPTAAAPPPTPAEEGPHLTSSASNLAPASLPPLPPVNRMPTPDPNRVTPEASRRRFMAVLFGLFGFLLLLITFVGTRC